MAPARTHLTREARVEADDEYGSKAAERGAAAYTLKAEFEPDELAEAWAAATTHWRWVGPPPKTNPLRQQMSSVRELDQAVGLTLDGRHRSGSGWISARGAARQSACVTRDDHDLSTVLARAAD